MIMSSNGIVTVKPWQHLEFPPDLKAYTSATLTNISFCENQGEVTTNDSRKQILKIFDLSTIKNYLKTDFFLAVGDEVLLELKGRKILDIIAAPVLPLNWEVGEVSSTSPNYFDVKLLKSEKTLQVRNEKMNRFDLSIVLGDVLAILPGQSQMSKSKKPFASKAAIICYGPRTTNDLLEFILNTKSQLKSGKLEIMDILRNTKPWRFVVQGILNQPALMTKFVDILLFVVREGKPQPGLLTRLLDDLVFKSDLFSIIEKLSVSIDKHGLLMNFFDTLLSYVPKAEAQIKALKLLMIKQELKDHPRRDKIIHLIDSLNGQKEATLNGHQSRISRKSFAIAPVSFFPNCKLEHMEGLEAVKLSSPFADSDEYLDIFFKLVSYP